MRKVEGAGCPKCHAAICAEFVMRGEQPRWRCNHCGAEGDLVGAVAIRSGYKKPEVKKTHKAWGSKIALAMMVGLLIGCQQKPAADLRTAVNICVEKEFLEECEELSVRVEAEMCRKHAKLAATRTLASIPSECLGE